jgi:hypothetical protein
MASSAAQAALPILREIDLLNRHITATVVSRLASNGMLLFPTEVVIPQKDQDNDASDPFIKLFIEAAKTAIADPGSASAAIPIPLRVPQELIEKFKHITFATPLDKQIADNREKALIRLATAMNLPAEVITGMGDMNHWGQWQLEESAVKIHFNPMAEVICNALTEGYLWPMMKAAGIFNPTDEPYIIWYDSSAITQTPDRSKPAQDLHAVGMVKDKVLRTANGFDEDDAPTDDEVVRMALINLAMQVGPLTGWALAKLTGDESFDEREPVPSQLANAEQDVPEDESGAANNAPPNTRPEEQPENEVEE